MLSLRNLTIHSNQNDILSDFSADFSRGMVYAVMGPNGSGKSTMARTIIGDPALTRTAGDIFLDDTSITALPPYERARRGIFYSPQSPPPCLVSLYSDYYVKQYHVIVWTASPCLVPSHRLQKRCIFPRTSSHAHSTITSAVVSAKNGSSPSAHHAATLCDSG